MRLTISAALLLSAVCTVLPLLGWGKPLHSRSGFQTTNKSSESEKARPGTEITLTDVRPTACLPVAPANLAGSSTYLAITLARINNSNQVAFSVMVYLEPQTSARDKSPGGTKAASPPFPPILLGNLGVYPSDQPGRYQLDISSSLHRLRDSGQDLTHLCLRLTLKRLHLNQPATGLKVVLSLPEWTHAAQ
jgi:hypothetical protein